MGTTQGTGGVLARLGDLTYRRRGRTVLAWVALLVAVVAIGPQIAAEFDEDYSTPGSESKAAATLLAARFEGMSGGTIDVVWQAPAAAIMIVVFLAFVGSSVVFLKLMGIGMATAILVDATIVRMLLVPAVMQLLGQATWWLPGWLDRILPTLDVEPAAAPRPVLQRAEA